MEKELIAYLHSLGVVFEGTDQEILDAYGGLLDYSHKIELGIESWSEYGEIIWCIHSDSDLLEPPSGSVEGFTCLECGYDERAIHPDRLLRFSDITPLPSKADKNLDEQFKKIFEAALTLVFGLETLLMSEPPINVLEKYESIFGPTFFGKTRYQLRPNLLDALCRDDTRPELGL